MRPAEVAATSEAFAGLEGSDGLPQLPECGFQWEAKRGPFPSDGMETVRCRSAHPHKYHTARTSLGQLRKRLGSLVQSWARDPCVAQKWAERVKRILERQP